MPISKAGSSRRRQRSKIGRSTKLMRALRTKMLPSRIGGEATLRPACTSPVTPMTSSSRPAISRRLAISAARSAGVPIVCCEPVSMTALTRTPPTLASTQGTCRSSSLIGSTVKPGGALRPLERVISMRSFLKSARMRRSASAVVASTPSAPPNTSSTTTKVCRSASRSPTSTVRALTIGARAEPVVPRSSTVRFGSTSSPSRVTAVWVRAERVAPVSSTSRSGPLPSMYTGTQMRPIRSRRVGETYRGSGAEICTSSRSGVGGASGGTLDRLCAVTPPDMMADKTATGSVCDERLSRARHAR